MKERTNGVFRGAQRMPSFLNRQFSWWTRQGRQHEKWDRMGSGKPRSRLTFYAAAGVSFTSASIAVIAVYDRKQMSASRADNRQLPLNYDPGAFAAFWDQHVCMQLARVGTITVRVVPFLLRSAWLYYHPVSSSRQISESEPHTSWGADWGAELRELLVDLGPTFIKFGQMLSIRPDLLPAPVLRELQRLCDAVPAFPTPEAIDLIERELGSGAVARLFEGLDNNTMPVAAASLGQVYCCRLREEGKRAGTGALVALKVQRPDMVISVSLDLLLLRRYMQIVEVIKKSMMEAGIIAKRKQFDIDLLDTFAAASFCELDYQHEAANQERFQYELEKRGLSSTVRVPRVHRLGTSRRVLTTEWIHGKQLAHSSPETIRKLVPAGVEVFLVQLLDMGFFHSDPHPGNLLVDTQNRLVLIDFGLCAEVQQLDTRGMTKAIVHLMKGDVSALIDDAVALRFLPHDVDKTTLLPALQAVFDEARIAAESTDAKQHLFKTQARRQELKQISAQLNGIFYKFPFVVPEYFALITRALIVLEGIAVTGDRDFDIFAAAYPYACKRASETIGWRELRLLQEASKTPGPQGHRGGWLSGSFLG